MKKAHTILINIRHGDLEFLISRWSIEIHTFKATCGEFGPALEKTISALTVLPLFAGTHPTGVVLDEDDKEKLDFLNDALLAFKPAWEGYISHMDMLL